MQGTSINANLGPLEPGGNMMPISDAEFNALRTLIYNRFGINLTDQKKSLLVGRLQKLLRQQGFANFQNYYDFLVKEPGEKGLSDLINLVSTNYTYFNREKDHFDYFLQTALPTVLTRLRQENRRDLRVWCAGCSTGEEAYTLLILMHECLGQEYSRWDAGILATDISQRVLETAAAGVYPEDRIASLPEAWRRKYFRKISGNQWEVVDTLKKEATFRRFNLMNTQFPFKKPFHIIFCRNVMIYFDQPTRDALVKRFHQHTEPGGYLFIGHSETLGRNQSLYRYLMPAAYQKGTL